MTANAKPATQLVTTNETQQQKQLTAMIDAAAVASPDLKSRVTLAAVWQYMQLPDASFGWVPRTEPGQPPPPLPFQCKALCVITTLALGLTPGLGHVLWLGNKCFIDIYGKRMLAARTPGFALGGRKIRPLTTEEKEMFGLAQGDRALALEQDFKRGGAADWTTVTAYGIIDINEFSVGKNGKPGLQSRKDVAMTMITRAERDFYNRFFPIDGMADMPDDPKAYVAEVEARQLAHLPSKDATTIATINAEVKDTSAADNQAAELEIARGIFNQAATAVKDQGGDVTRILESDPATITEAADLLAAADVLEAWLEEIGKDPEPTPPAGKVGRRRKDPPKPELATKISLAGDVTPPAAPSAEVDAQVERDVSPAALEAKHPGDPNLYDSNNPNPHLVGKARRRFSDALKRVNDLGGAPMKIIGINPHNLLEGTSVAAMEEAAILLDKWSPTNPSPIEKNQALKANPPPERNDVPPPDEPYQSAARPAPAGRKDERAAVKEEAKPKPSVVTPPAKPAAGSGPAYGMIERALGMDDVPDAVRSKLSELATLALQGNDHLHLPRMIRVAKAGDTRELDELLQKRGGKKG